MQLVILRECQACLQEPPAPEARDIPEMTFSTLLPTSPKCRLYLRRDGSLAKSTGLRDEGGVNLPIIILRLKNLISAGTILAPSGRLAWLT